MIERGEGISLALNVEPYEVVSKTSQRLEDKSEIGRQAIREEENRHEEVGVSFIVYLVSAKSSLLDPRIGIAHQLFK